MDLPVVGYEQRLVRLAHGAVDDAVARTRGKDVAGGGAVTTRFDRAGGGTDQENGERLKGHVLDRIQDTVIDLHPAGFRADTEVMAPLGGEAERIGISEDEGIGHRRRLVSGAAESQRPREFAEGGPGTSLFSGETHP